MQTLSTSPATLPFTFGAHNWNPSGNRPGAAAVRRIRCPSGCPYSSRPSGFEPQPRQQASERFARERSEGDETSSVDEGWASVRLLSGVAARVVHDRLEPGVIVEGSQIGVLRQPGGIIEAELDGLTKHAERTRPVPL